MIAVLLVSSACGRTDVGTWESEVADHAVSHAAVDGCAWDPVFGTQDCFQSDWWMEFSVRDSTVTVLEVEISGTTPRVVRLPTRVTLANGYFKFTGGAGSAVPAGTSIRLRATQAASSGGLTATSAWFGYRTGTPVVECTPCTPTCAPDTCGSDGCGGTCACPAGSTCRPDQTCCTPTCAPGTCGSDGCGGTCACPAGSTCSDGTCVPGCTSSWEPRWQQTANGSNWWAEFRVFGGGSLARSVSLEVPDVRIIPLSLSYGQWSGGAGGLATGTTVVLHATDATGATAQTHPFRYLVDLAPPTDACRGTPSTSPTCTPLARGMVSFTMDDSHPAQDTLARPLLTQYGMRATIYHITNQLSSYGLLPNAQSLAAAGNEVGSHTRTHPNLTTISAEALDDELRSSRQYLLSNVGSPVESIASPMGAYNAAVVAAMRGYYGSHRTVNPGLNYMGSDVYQLTADGVFNNTTVASICAMLTETAANRGWRILGFHNFTTEPTSSASLLYPIANFEGILRCAQQTPGLDVVTTREGADRLRCASP